MKIKDLGQPMLESAATARDIRGGAPNKILLVPELCCATGFTDRMKSNFRLMADVAQYTRVAPDARMERLLAFNRRLNGTPDSAAVFREWNLTLEENLVEVGGRTLPREPILFGNGKT